MTNTGSVSKSAFAIGIPEVDEEHRVLFECLEAITASLNTGFSQAQCQSTLEKLTEYTRIHFRVEECLMRLFDYPELESHQREHTQFLSNLEDFRTKAMTEDVSRQMAIFLTQWLLNHIHLADSKYVTYFKQRNGPQMSDDN